MLENRHRSRRERITEKLSSRALALCQEALGLDAWQRRRFLDAECGGDPRLREEVEQFLSHETLSESFLRPRLGRGGAEEKILSSGTTLGAYRLREKLGEGGMGQVFLATRDDRLFERQVAVKVLRERMASEWAQARFVQERQILASLDHPGIASLLDGGTTPDGAPYLVMELVRGEPITTFCDRRRLTTDRRLRLFLTVCEAVRHAHQNLVVHRDLKPSNILVAEDGRPKVLDFGIAKIVGVASEMERTATADRTFTPSYASPEQIRGDGISTATDTYSLGVLLFELLTGSLPFEHSGASQVQLLEEMCRRSAPPPSVAVERSADPEIAAARGANRQELCRGLRGDVDTIVGKALRAEPEHRYSSVAELAEDVRRSLDRLPILARPPSVGYRTRRWLQRHSALAVALGLLVSSVATVLVVTLLQSHRVSQQRLAAELERDRAERVTGFLIDMFAENDPSSGGDRGLDLAGLLDSGARRAARELNDQPETQATLLAAIASVHQGVGRLDEARALARDALRRRTALFGECDPSVADSRLQLAGIERDRGELDAAKENLRAALVALAPESDDLDSVRRHLPVPEETLATCSHPPRHDFGGSGHGAASHESTLELLETTGSILREAGDYPAALEVSTDALELVRGVDASPSLELAGALANVAILQHYLQLLDEAESSYREALWMYESLDDAARPREAIALTDFALVLADLGKLAEAEEEARRAVSMHQRHYGREHYLYAVSLSNLGIVSMRRGRFAAAADLYRRALEIESAALGADHPRVAEEWNNLGSVLLYVGDLEQAAEPLRRALSIRRRTLGEEHALTTLTMLNLANLLQRTGDDAEASRLSYAAAETLAKRRGEDSPEYGRVLNGLAFQSLRLGDYEAAERLAREAVRIYRRAFGEESWRTAVAESRLGVALAGLGDVGGAGESFGRGVPNLRQDGLAPYLQEVEEQLETLSEARAIPLSELLVLLPPPSESRM